MTAYIYLCAKPCVVNKYVISVHVGSVASHNDKERFDHVSMSLKLSDFFAINIILFSRKVVNSFPWL